MSQIKIQKVADCRLVCMHRKRRRDGKYQGQHHQVIAVDLQRALPQPVAHHRRIPDQLAKIKPAHQQRGNKHKPFGRGDKANRRIDEIAEPRWQMRQRHPDKEKPAQGIKLGTAI
jgi:hypothetical protein